MTLKQGLQFCKRIANNATENDLNIIKVKSVNNKLELTATDSYRIVKYTIENTEKIKLNTFVASKNVKRIKTFDDLIKYQIPAKYVKNNFTGYPNIEKIYNDIKFTNHIDIELEPLRRFCKMYKDKNIDIKISGREFVLSYRDDEIKTSILIRYIKSNIKYYRTRLNAKLLLEILPRENTIKIKVGKSGRDPISFDDQIIMPISIEA